MLTAEFSWLFFGEIYQIFDKTVASGSGLESNNDLKSMKYWLLNL